MEPSHLKIEEEKHYRSKSVDEFKRILLDYKNMASDNSSAHESSSFVDSV